MLYAKEVRFYCNYCVVCQATASFEYFGEKVKVSLGKLKAGEYFNEFILENGKVY